jgi:plasmid stabilization system protein ParE
VTYRILPAAFKDLGEIDDWVLENFGSSFADETKADLLRAFSLFSHFPSIGVARPEVTKMPFRFFLLKPYWIVYQPGAPTLIHRVYHSARDLRRLDRH